MRSAPRRGPRRLRRVGVGGWVVALLLVTASAAHAAPIPELRNELTDLEFKARNLKVNYDIRSAARSTEAESRLVDAQVLYQMKDYTRAAILLIDYVHKYPNSQGYPEALFFLADSLYQRRNFLSAKRYFNEIVDKVRGRYYQEALQRLVELSLRLGDTSQIESYLRALSSIPTSRMKESVPYVVAKFHYFKGDNAKAIQAFRQIPQKNKYYLHAQYFIGVALVRSKDYAGAAKVFQTLLRSYPQDKYQKHVKDLAYMALGRLFYEDGKIADAIAMYEKVPRTSPEFDTALYEIAWAYVKKKDYRKALRALELLDLANPNSPFIPEVKVLQGNLLIRLKQWTLATDLFSRTRERFHPVWSRMKQVMDEHNNADVFFDLLLARNIGKFAIKIQVPALAIHWVKEKAGIKQALNLVQDVRGLSSDITEATKLIKQLERAINSPAKIKIFPEFAEAKARALEVENRVVLARVRILSEERKRVEHLASGSEKDEMLKLSARRVNLSKQLKDLPTSAAEYEGRAQKELELLATLSKELNRLSILVESLRAQLVAAEKYFEDTSTNRSKSVRDEFRKEVQGVKDVIQGLQDEVEEVQQEVVAARAATGVGGGAEVSERKIKERLRALVTREQAILEGLRTKLSGPAAEEFDTLAAMMQRCGKLDAFLADFDKKLESGVEKRLVDVRNILSEEKTNVAQYGQELTAYKSQTNQAAGSLTYAGFQDVAKKFYEIVVRSDVGIIDVAWALKDSKSKEVTRLVRQRNADLKMLDDEFREVLADD